MLRIPVIYCGFNAMCKVKCAKCKVQCVKRSAKCKAQCALCKLLMCTGHVQYDGMCGWQFGMCGVPLLVIRTVLHAFSRLEKIENKVRELEEKRKN